jgi:colanic acid/amylovoran biosynthesis glycosyltransferase
MYARDDAAMRPLKVAYLLLYFPKLTETFVATEIESIRSRNIDVRIISLLSAGSGPVQSLSQKLLQYTWYAPSVLNWALWRAQVYFLFKSSWLYMSLLATLLTQPCPKRPLTLFLKRLVIFLKAVSVAHYLQGTGIDLLHSHFAWLPGAATWICARLLGIPFTVTVHAYDIYSSKNDLLPLISRQAAHVVAISEFNRQHVACLGTCGPEQISVIHCGLNLSLFHPQLERGLDQPIGSVLRILSVGSLVAKKGHLTLIRACYLLRERGSKFSCTIIGGGPEDFALRQQIEGYGLQLHVRLLGACSHPEIMAAYDEHDLFVLACTVAPDGDRDGIPVALMEAGKKGLPLVSTAISGIPELVRDGETGILVPPDDAIALGDTIARLAADPALRARLGRNARELVETEFSIESSTVRLAALFRNTCQRSEVDCMPASQSPVLAMPERT